MKLLDINSNFSDAGGGIRTYHRAKCAWFDRQRRHRYYFIVPGPRHAVRRVGRRSVRIEVYGCPFSGAYRFLLDYPRVWRIARRLRPQIIEAGDPLLTTVCCLLLRAFRLLPGHLTSFFHSDPIETWVVPWAGRGCAFGWRRWAAAIAGRCFYRWQSRCDVVVVASRSMQQHLRSRGVRRVTRKPLGVDPIFLDVGPRRHQQATADRPRRLLFVGRLGSDKGADLLLAILPRILNLSQVELTIVGSGGLEPEFAKLNHPGLHLRGYVCDREQLAAIYAEHDVLLAPGPYETFGLAVLEAMAAGLVVVGPDRGGTGDFVREAGGAYLFRAGDAEDFFRAVASAAADGLGGHSAAAQAIAQRYGTWDDAIGRLVEFYESLCQSATVPALPAPEAAWHFDGPESTDSASAGLRAHGSPVVQIVSRNARKRPSD